jgi:hypothetical protein
VRRWVHMAALFAGGGGTPRVGGGGGGTLRVGGGGGGTPGRRTALG